MAYFISMNALISLLVVLTLAGSIEGRFFDTRTPASQPSASARARAHRLLDCSPHKIPSIETSHKKKSAWECVDLEQELTACGKCDNDCMRLPNVENSPASLVIRYPTRWISHWHNRDAVSEHFSFHSATVGISSPPLSATASISSPSSPLRNALEFLVYSD
ncbi:hypothetical protein PSHT_12342 [Puccinia striiformis]|uniref:Secreted protein n=1 Tax=Puccinia striiformis TaxID=27350 RepID=A0A2S4UXI4_9BASI|nr:hypothetical protein PSHT_12342 [Puccinia striiformis]